MPDDPERSLPRHCPGSRERDDLELLLAGAYAPVRGFDEPGSVVTLTLPEELRDREVELTDPEGLPLATLARDGTVTALSPVDYGPFRRLHLAPDEAAARHSGRAVVPVHEPLTGQQLDELRDAGPLMLLAFSGTGTSSLSPVGLLRATLVAAELLPDAVVVAAPVPDHGDADADRSLRRRVADRYAQGHPVHRPSPAAEPAGFPDPVQQVIDFDRPPPDEQGLVVFFTGLSGSGKSTIARALVDHLLERGERTVTSLDGDVVRRHLSAGLTFSREDRETNIRRIGWVAAEIARHGGVAVCSPIAPFDETRQDVRRMVTDAGGRCVLVHVATPLAECERRDRKGLYAKARRGEITEFTGISSPYEEPADADLRLDTTGRSVAECLEEVLPLVERPAPDPGGATGSLDPADPFRVLFVCRANICRSAYLELAARERLGGDSVVEVSSAGTHGFTDSPMDEEIAGVLQQRGVDTDGFRSRPLTRSMVERADLVLTVEAQQRSFVLQEVPRAFRRVFTLGQYAHDTPRSYEEDDVADPYRRGREAAELAAARMDELLTRALARIEEER